MIATNKTLANIQSVLRKALDRTLEDEIIEVSPLACWCYSKIESPQKRNDIDPFTKDEQATILSRVSGQGRNLLQFAFWTGFRTSELVALNWTDIDSVRGVAMVARAMTQHSLEAEEPKSSSGRREIKLLQGAVEAVHAQKAHTWLTGCEVFQNPQTKLRWAGDQSIRKILWTRALKRGGVLCRNPYQTRHTYASMMLSAGEHPMLVAKKNGAVGLDYDR